MRALAPLFLGHLALLGCGSGDGVSAAAALTSSLSPDPIVEATCPPADCGALASQLQASASLTVRETAGVGVNLDSVSMRLESQSPATLIASGVWTGPALVQQAGGSARVAGMGSRNVSVSLHYDQSAGGHPATFSVTVIGTDDGGHAVSTSASTQVTP